MTVLLRTATGLVVLTAQIPERISTLQSGACLLPHPRKGNNRNLTRRIMMTGKDLVKKPKYPRLSTLLCYYHARFTREVPFVIGAVAKRFCEVYLG
jgi:hypothetical protein